MPRGYSLVESTGQRAATGHGGWPVTISVRTWGDLVSRRRPRATDPGPAGDASYGVSFSVSASMGLLLVVVAVHAVNAGCCARIACLGPRFTVAGSRASTASRRREALAGASSRWSGVDHHFELFRRALQLLLMKLKPVAYRLSGLGSRE